MLCRDPRHGSVNCSSDDYLDDLIQADMEGQARFHLMPESLASCRLASKLRYQGFASFIKA